MFLIDLSKKESIYEQIKTQIERFIKVGVLKPNDKLPSVRNLAMELGINPNTVMKAYAELEQQGIIYTVNKKGAFVAKDITTKKESSKEDAIKMLKAIKDEGFSLQEVKELLKEIY